jgi:hypothetical protein
VNILDVSSGSYYTQAGGKVDGAQGVGVNATKVQEALKIAQDVYDKTVA